MVQLKNHTQSRAVVACKSSAIPVTPTGITVLRLQGHLEPYRHACQAQEALLYDSHRVGLSQTGAIHERRLQRQVGSPLQLLYKCKLAVPSQLGSDGRIGINPWTCASHYLSTPLSRAQQQIGARKRWRGGRPTAEMGIGNGGHEKIKTAQ